MGEEKNFPEEGLERWVSKVLVAPPCNLSTREAETGKSLGLTH